MIKNKDLEKRKEGIRHPAKIYKLFSLDEIVQVFNNTTYDIERVLDFLQNTKELEEEIANEMLRYQIVRIESAFDYAVHQIIKYGMIQIFNGVWEETEKYNSFQVSFKQLKTAIDDGVDENWILEMIDNKYASQTLLGYKELKEALNIVYPNILETCATKIYCVDKSTALAKLKEELSSIYQRRNAIAHQSDREHYNGEKKEITFNAVADAKSSINRIFNSIIEILNDLDKVKN